MKEVNIFWFRRDLRTFDNHALSEAIKKGNVLPLFIFDEEILNKLPDKTDARVNFIHNELKGIYNQLGGNLKVVLGNPKDIFTELCLKYNIQQVFTNKDYEPYAKQRDKSVYELLKDKGIKLSFFKDQVIFEMNEVVKKDGTPYTVYTPYKNCWLSNLNPEENFREHNCDRLLANLIDEKFDFPSLEEIGFKPTGIKIPAYDLSDNIVKKYDEQRNFPALAATTYLGIYLRFGTVSIRQLAAEIKQKNEVLLSELIWREFFMQILYHFPHVVEGSFKPKYDKIEWLNNEAHFKAWCNGETGYPIVDAGMRQLNQTGMMHNRVRMIVASFLIKHLLVDWKWGEQYFADKLLDFELASNNGNWQWAAGTGCDSAPYFRVFNPYEQHKKFDKNSEYIKKWVPEYQELSYTKPIVEHKFGRERAIAHYKKYLTS